MLLIIVFVFGILGQLSSGVPLESPSSELSGFFGERIVGGSEAALGRAPHMAALLVGDIWQAFVCGASIITRRHLLTAAHCVIEDLDGTMLSTFHGIVGTNIWQKGIVLEFKSHKLHPDYDYWSIKNDVAVLTTSDDIQMNERVATIALNFGHVGGGERSFVTGWGTQRLWGPTPDNLQILYLDTISPKECINKIKQVAETNPWVPSLDPALEICTLHSPGQGLCHGDSGSALVSVKTGKQSGVVSWAISLCAKGEPDVYARVASAEDFIQEHTRLPKLDI